MEVSTKLMLFDFELIVFEIYKWTKVIFYNN